MPMFYSGSAPGRFGKRAIRTTKSLLLDHVVGAGDERWRHVEAERLGGDETWDADRAITNVSSWNKRTTKPALLDPTHKTCGFTD
jgi:hypothetical protein